ncbi:class I SAM-dependent methyltransferase [Candidatus Bathyarchaeota archaeon]|nr:class I SAM-dependent methyltransferase [Candidatus Bathyarchaeota archaeon]
MREEFGRSYFYGFSKSNYLNYEKLDPAKLFSGIIYFVKKHNIKVNKVLDVGCAFGFLLKELSSVFDELHGFDISEFAIGKAKQVVPEASLKIHSLEDPLPYADNSFDCITAIDVLEHTKNFEKNFEEIVKKLKKGGYLIVSTPLDEWPRRYFGFLDKDKTHISVLQEQELKRIIKKYNLKTVDKRYYAPFPVIYRIPGIPFSIEILLRKQ